MNRIDIGRVFGDIFTVWWKNVGVYMGVSFALWVPVFLLNLPLLELQEKLGGPFGMQPVDEAEVQQMMIDAIPFWIGIILLSMFSGVVGSAFYGYHSAMFLRGSPVTLGAAFGRVFSRIFAVFLISLILAVSFMICCVPFLVLSLWLYVTVPALLVENIGVSRAIDRSSTLLEGNRIWGPLLFIILYVGMFMLGIPGGVVQFVDPFWGQAVSGLASIVTLPFFGIAPAVLYVHLVRATGGFTETLTEVFE